MFNKHLGYFESQSSIHKYMDAETDQQQFISPYFFGSFLLFVLCYAIVTWRPSYVPKMV